MNIYKTKSLMKNALKNVENGVRPQPNGATPSNTSSITP